jgi:VWFA-related protein
MAPLALLLVALPATAAEKAEKAPTAEKRFSQSTDVVAVEVPVQVLRDGQPVRGLTAADFELYEGRNKQPITGFEVLDLQSVPADKPAAIKALPPSARRRFLLLFDLSFSSQTKIAKAQEAARRLLRNRFHPADLIGVAAYAPSKGPRLLVGFTSDRRAVEQAIDKIGVSELSRITFDPLDLASLPEGGGDGPSGGRGLANRRESAGGEARSDDTSFAPDPTGAGNTAFLSMFERQKREAKTQDITSFLRSVEGFAKALSTIQGRKYVVLLSEGFDSSLLLGTSDADAVADQTANAMAGETWKVDTDVLYGNTHSSNTLEKMLESLRRADCVVQSVDIGGVRAEQGGTGEDGLFVMADSTGGELYRNFNDLTEAVGKMLVRTSVTYVLTFQPDVARDGSYHKLRVELKDRALGQAVYRPGYYAPIPYAQQKPIEKLLTTAGAVVSGREGGPVSLAVLAAPFANAGGKAYVPVLLEIDGPSLLGGATSGTLPAEVYVYALDGQGIVRDYFTQTVGLDLAKLGKSLLLGGIKFYGDLELPAGTYTLRILVRNGQSGSSGIKSLALDVPGFEAGKPVLLPAFFPAPTERWLIAREAKSRQGEVPYPFMLQGKPYVPASHPTLQPGSDVAMALVGYGLGAGNLSVQATVLTADGREAAEGGVHLLGREDDPAGPERIAASFRTPKLPAGEYLLLVTLTDPKGGAQTSATPIVVAAAGGAHG